MPRSEQIRAICLTPSALTAKQSCSVAAVDIGVSGGVHNNLGTILRDGFPAVGKGGDVEIIDIDPLDDVGGTERPP